MISASRSASSPASGSCSRTPSSSVRAAEVVAERVRVVLLARQRLAGLLGGGAQGVGEAEPGLLRGQRGVLPGLRGRPPRSRRGRTAAGRPRGPGRARSRRPRRARARWPRSRRRQLGVRARAARRVASPPNRSRASRWARGRSSRCWSDWPCTATSGLGHVGQRRDRARRRRRRRPATGPRLDTLRASTTRSSSTSPPASSTAAANARQVADPDHALDPGRPGAGADGAAVGAAAEQQPEGGHHHGLAGAGLTGDRRSARGRARGSRTR